ncbi:HEAT repeat domain-containing protein [Paenibacillus koleovorans]|uniref:HEAT repeat domain-containing protein n=1 Tax=Paenibacillus koleovorans TaxID=121608 RepID=UPI000FDA78A2|nr:HEAT repeat domain-containing protein [Paenibacillus koleovorans]
MMDTKVLLTDEQMAQFITKGYVVLRNELPSDFHELVRNKIDYVCKEEGNPGNNFLPRVPEIGEFFETPVVRGALTSILGPDYFMHPHNHMHYNRPGKEKPQNWHKDGYWSSMRSHRPWWAMIFYYTHDVTTEMGPTAVMPGTQYHQSFIGEQGVEALPAGKAGTMVLAHFDIWHRGSHNLTETTRQMLKFQFVRRTAPTAPSWNHKNEELVLPDDLSFGQINLWQDVWAWLRGKERIDEQPTVDPSANNTSRLANLLDDSVEIAALNAAYALSHMGENGMNALFGQLTDGSEKAALRAAYGLQGCGRQAVPGLVERLRHPNEKRRALAAFVLGMLGSAAREAVSPLLAALADDSEWVRRNSIEALGMISEPGDAALIGIANALEQSLRDEAVGGSDANSHSIQPYILNKIGYTSTLSLSRLARKQDADLIVGALKQALESRDRYVRAYASEALSLLRTEEALEVLFRFFKVSRWCKDTHKASNT